MRQCRVRKQSGLAALELAMISFLGIIMVCIALDLGLMMLGNQQLDRATRDAARAAASQPDAVNALKAANAVLKTHKADGFWVQDPTIEPGTFVYQDYGGTPSPVNNKNSFVELTCLTNVRLPANLTMFGLSLNQGALATGKMQFKRHYWFPIVKQTLNANYQ